MGLKITLSPRRKRDFSFCRAICFQMEFDALLGPSWAPRRAPDAPGELPRSISYHFLTLFWRAFLVTFDRFCIEIEMLVD